MSISDDLIIKGFQQLDSKLDSKLDKISDNITDLKVDLAEHKVILSTHLESDQAHQSNINTELKKTSEELAKTSDCLKEYNHQLTVHMKRTDLIEAQSSGLYEALEAQKKAYLDLATQIQEKLDKLHEPYRFFKFTKKALVDASKISAGLGAISGIIMTILHFLHIGKL